MSGHVEAKKCFNLTFDRNRGTFPGNKIPLDFQFAERLDGNKLGVPRASYYVLNSETAGLPICLRVAESLQKTFQSIADVIHKGHDEKFAEQQLKYAEQSVNDDNWSAAVYHSAEAYKIGGSAIKDTAKKILEHVLETVSAYGNFAAAPTINKLQTDIGQITIPACITSTAEKEFFHGRFNYFNSVKDKDKEENKGTYSAVIGYKDGSRDDSLGPEDYS